MKFIPVMDLACLQTVMGILRPLFLNHFCANYLSCPHTVEVCGTYTILQKLQGDSPPKYPFLPGFVTPTANNDCTVIHLEGVSAKFGTCVPFTLTLVLGPNLALPHTKTDNSVVWQVQLVSADAFALP